jgi:hypothetical protein
VAGLHQQPARIAADMVDHPGAARIAQLAPERVICVALVEVAALTHAEMSVALLMA